MHAGIGNIKPELNWDALSKNNMININIEQLNNNMETMEDIYLT